MSPALYLISTPIGNMEDITFRALRLLKEVDLLLAEDTRRTGLLLAHFTIRTRLLSCHTHNENRRIERVLEVLERGESVGLVTDAGTPSLADPGSTMVRAVLQAGYNVIPLPGPNAAISAFSVSGMNTSTITITGFLPKKRGSRKKTLKTLLQQGHPFSFYESPHRVISTLETLTDIIETECSTESSKAAPEPQIIVAREITKHYEEFIRGSLSEVCIILNTKEEVRGEITVLVDPGQELIIKGKKSLDELLAQGKEEGLFGKDLVLWATQKSNYSKKEIYKKVHQLPS